MAKGKETMITDLTTGSVPKQLIKFAAPLFLSGVLQTVYNSRYGSCGAILR